MSTVFLISDTHFGHAGVCHFLRDDGTKLRPWNSPEAMDEAMVKLWNDTVGPKDKVYHLGDVVINRRALATLHRLNGEKVLIKGNHDIFRPEEYMRYFKDLRGYHVINNMLLSHIPVHPDSKGRFAANIHGHTHAYNVMDQTGEKRDPWYECVCVEQIDYKPISLEQLMEKMKCNS